MEKRNGFVYRIVVTALMAALVTAMTLVHIPVPGMGTGAYIHPGDSMVYASAWMLGPLGVIPAAVGSALADLIVPDALVYAPATLVIKALMALIAVGLLRLLGDRVWARLAAMLAAGVFMAAGYAAYEWLLFGWAKMLIGLPYNFIQALGGVAIALPLLEVLNRVPQVRALRRARETVR